MKSWYLQSTVTTVCLLTFKFLPHSTVSMSYSPYPIQNSQRSEDADWKHPEPLHSDLDINEISADQQRRRGEKGNM